MDWIEVTAKTVEAAKELALDRLGVVEDELEYEVIDEPRGGFLRRSDARIRARVLPLSREKPSDRRRRRGGERQGGRTPGGGARSGATTEERRAGAPAGDGAASPGGGGARSRSRGRRGRGGQARTAAISPNGGEEQKPEEQVETETLPLPEQAQFATAFADELVRAMGFRATVRTDVGDDDLMVCIDGENLGVLVGPRGVTLQALDEVVRAALQRHAGGHSARVHVDVDGYRERRREALGEFARKVAGEVRETGVARSLEPMSGVDRKVVHDAVSEIEGVATGSEGDEPRRRVVISPE